LRYIPNSPDEKSSMLKASGLKSSSELFVSIPEELRLQRTLKTPAALSEIEVIRRFQELGDKNGKVASFLGAGAYFTL
jgi:glycine dehydrogenase subunit 1